MLRHRGSVRPHAHAHVVAGAHQDVAGVRAPRNAADRVLVACHERQGTAGRVADIERAYDAIDARRGDHRVVIFVPVVRQDFVWYRSRVDGTVGKARVTRPARGRRVHGDHVGQVVLGRYGRAQVEDAQGRVGGDGGDEGGVRGAVGGAVGAATNGEGLEGGVARGGPLKTK